ncbi:hypothetical protein GO495_11560 [Chitinophaga oryziterrae]|uniref:Uncharacterized protein n=1 Tax=Chitinophaga oryziterrae TaxID=1031224 RepID=A0A6N8J9F0_9BACT|nr:hypothetical protein [Chitinophaga oryziterrae]MVT41221.1 hypothetical protein [Chitinophaga oryziterrae]
MSTSVITLTSIVYHLCNVKEDNLRDKKQYEAQKAALLAEIHTIREAIVINAASIVNEEEHQQFIKHKYRILTLLESLLEEAISQKGNKFSFTTQLLKEVLSHTGVLNYFVRYHFSQTSNVRKEGSSASVRNFTAVEKMKLDISAAGMAVLTKAFVKSTPHISRKAQEELIPFVVENFTSKQTDDLAITTFKKNYRHPERAAIDDAIGFLTRMISHLRKL